VAGDERFTKSDMAEEFEKKKEPKTINNVQTTIVEHKRKRNTIKIRIG